MMIVGVSAGAILLFKKLIPLADVVWIVLLALGFAILLTGWIIRPAWGGKLLALSAAIVFPHWECMFFARNPENTI